MTVEQMVELLEIEKECVLRNASGECNRYCAGCDLLQDDTELHEMYTEAIALLKAQEPRVMTLEEVIERKDSDAVWVEHMDGKMIVQPAVLLPSFLDTDKDCIHFASSWRTGGSYGRRSYGTKWRCWTSHPTDEQREKVKWDG